MKTSSQGKAAWLPELIFKMARCRLAKTETPIAAVTEQKATCALYFRERQWLISADYGQVSMDGMFVRERK